MKIYKLFFFAVICILPLKSFSQYAFEWTGISPRFENGISKLVAYIDFGEAVLWGNVEVSLTYSYNSQNTTGLYRKSYNIGRNNIATINSNTSEVTSSLGPVADQWKLGDFEVNSSNHLVIPIYHLVSTGNSIIVNIRGVSQTTINTSLINITAPIVLENTMTRDYNYIRGKLSIGTSKADSDALLTVAGNINSKELKVKINAGADFVFAKDYPLPDLNTVECFINSNQHLPDIPSANEMKASGLDVGNFQIKLLQKIEELTLHLIEMKKENEVFKKQLLDYKKDIEILKSKINEIK